MNKKDFNQISRTQHLLDDINSAVSVFVGVPRSIIRRQAEQEAERYVSSSLGLEDDDARKDLIKLEYIDSFTDKIKWQI